MTCPRCDADMAKREHARAVIDECEKCHGNFFDEGEMLAVLGKTADPELWGRMSMATPEAAARCPRCKISMAIFNVSGIADFVEVDRCLGCGGIWLDGGEVEAIMRIGAEHLASGVVEDPSDAADGDEGGGMLICRFYDLMPDE